MSRLIRKLRPFMVKAAEFFWQTVSADEPCEVVADIAETMKIRRIPKANPWILLWIGEPGRVVNALRC